MLLNELPAIAVEPELLNDVEAVTSDQPLEAKLQPGTVARLHPDAGFGYVRDASGEHSYIFLVGKALKHSQARLLSVGKPVQFRVSGQGQVDELVVG